jgi:hypothetical protein
MNSKFLNIGLALPAATIVGLAMASPSMATTSYSIKPLGNTVDDADSINNSGQVIPKGKTINNQGQRVEGRTLFNKDGTKVDLGNLPDGYFGDTTTTAHAINNLSQVVGVSGGSAFLWTKEKGIQGIGSTFSFGKDINDKGQVALSEGSPSRGYEAILYDINTGKRTTLANLNNGYVNHALGLNSKGEVVGNSYTDFSVATLYKNGKVQNLNEAIAPNSGWKLEFATDINDKGQIIGRGTFNGQENQGFLLTPINHQDAATVPEPTSGTGALIFGAIGVVWMFKKQERRKKIEDRK